MISLDDMSALARTLVEAEEGVEIATNELKRAKEKARGYREETIPCAMHELGLKEVQLETGEKLSVKQEVYCSIPSSNKNEAHNWLHDNGFGGLVKTGITALYSKGDYDKASEISELIKAINRLSGVTATCTLSESVHTGTLKAFIKEQLAGGEDVPLELFGAMPVWTTKITKK